jgi:transposase InsO family protein
MRCLQWGIRVDVTYVDTGQGLLYLAAVIDLFSRQIVGWSMQPRMKKGLVIDALRIRDSDGIRRRD